MYGKRFEKMVWAKDATFMLLCSGPRVNKGFMTCLSPKPYLSTHFGPRICLIRKSLLDMSEHVCYMQTKDYT